MKKTLSFIIAILFVFVLSACWLMEKTIVGDGEKVTYEYNVEDATELTINHIYLENNNTEIYSHLYIFDAEKEGEHRILIEGQQGIIDSIHVRCKDNKLSITGNFYEKYVTDLLAIKIYGFSFEKVTLDDVRGSMVSKMEAENISFELSGMSYLSCPNLKATTLNVSLKESAQLVLGNVITDETNLTLIDSSSLLASMLVAKKCVALLENASNITSKIVSDDFKFESSGTVNGTIDGSTTNTKIEVSGRSKLNCIALLTTYTEANIMGASSLSIYVSEELKAYINGDSSLSYKGNCKAKIDASGESIINHIE